MHFQTARIVHFGTASDRSDIFLISEFYLPSIQAFDLDIFGKPVLHMVRSSDEEQTGFVIF